MTAQTHQYTGNPLADLVLENIRIALGERQLIALSARIAPGEVLTIMGPSGSGKSSLLSHVAGFLDPAFSASGKVYLGDRLISDLPPAERQLGLLFQDALLFPHLSVGQNLMFAIPENRKGRALRRQLAGDALEDVGLDGLFDQDPARLSGGQKARVALARVLLSAPRALLLDEPFSRLDQQLRDQIRTLVFERAKGARLPVLLVTHDPQDGAHAQGTIIQVQHD